MIKVKVTDHTNAPTCCKCKAVAGFEIWLDGKSHYCDNCAVKTGKAQWWDIHLRYPTIKTPKLASGRFALRQKDKSWVAACNVESTPLRLVTAAKEARLFHSGWLNATNWQWSDQLTAVPENQLREVVAKEKKAKK